MRIPTLFLLIMSSGFANAASFAPAKRCGDSYVPAMRGFDVCAGDQPRAECPKDLKPGEMLWELPARDGVVAVVKARGESIVAVAGEPGHRIEGACHKVVKHSSHDEIQKSACPKGADKKIVADEDFIAADFLARVVVDMRGLVKEFKTEVPVEGKSTAWKRYDAFTSFKPDACRKALEELKALKKESLAKPLQELEAELKEWESLAAIRIPKKDATDGGAKKNDGKN